MGKEKKTDNQFDMSLLNFEVVTRIPKEKLIHIISSFYQNLGYTLINLRLQNPIKEEDYDFIRYEPDFKVDAKYSIDEIHVDTYETKNRRKFDKIKFRFESLPPQKTIIKVNFEIFVLPIWFMLYLLIALLVGLYFTHISYDNYPYTAKYIGALAFVLILIPGIIIVELFRMPKLKKLKKHPDFMRYKYEFEEHIRLKERELFPES
ncbi:hypothetical protein [Methanolobus vulcani]|uniref:Uncharacterized protein n=1 Tax=Methanolobus vulcani TaxID=38026 RepID=A0A7Z8KR57_9EURY|nr:hypothetical protein [Methanolobus vulcani]TQD28436.1 hypothetical protein FKV42_01905 [Methanolobus vulcani]